MSREAVLQFFENFEGRMIGDGLQLADLKEVRARCDDWSAWYGILADIGERYLGMAEASLRDGHRISAGTLFWLACMYYHYAQSYFFHEPALREAGQRKKVELYRRAAPLLSPAAERIEIPFENFTIPAYLRLPAGKKKPACAILIGGLESTKEESYLFENMCSRRGLATFAFDGPGQGEMYFQTTMRGDFERFTSAVIDYLETRPEIDAERLGVLGRSLGGHYAVKSAGFDQRIKSCIYWSGPYDIETAWDDMPYLSRLAYRYCAGQPTFEAAKEYLKIIDLRGWPEKLRCPLYILHGVRDHLIPLGHAERVAREARNVKQLVVRIEPEGNHSAHNLHHRVRYRMADFLADTLS